MAVRRSALAWSGSSGSGLPVHLETAREKNVEFYRGLGFDVTAEWMVPNGGPRFWSMLRS